MLYRAKLALVSHAAFSVWQKIVTCSGQHTSQLFWQETFQSPDRDFVIDA